jgi:HK97 family phage prohead protease
MRTRKFLDVSAFHARAARGDKFNSTGLRKDAAGGAKRDASSAHGASILWTFSTDGIDRQGDRITGWDLQNFRRNPVLLWAHDSSRTPIGRVLGINFNAGKLTGQTEFMSHDISEFADSIRRMVLGGFVSSASVGFIPREYKMSSDPARPGGVDITLAELLEISLCPIGANADAIVGASMKSARSSLSARKAKAPPGTLDIFRPARVARAAAIWRDINSLLKED